MQIKRQKFRLIYFSFANALDLREGGAVMACDEILESKNNKIYSPRWVLFRYLRFLISISCILALVNCATEAQKIPEYYKKEAASGVPDRKTVALIAVLDPPQIEGIDLGFTRTQGAAGGAAGGAVAGAGEALNALSGCGGDAACGAALLLLLPVFVVGGAVIGGVSGASRGDDAKKLAQGERDARKMLDSAFLENALLDQALSYARQNTDLEFARMPSSDQPKMLETPNYQSLANRNFDSALEINLLSMSLERSLEIRATARLIEVDTGNIVSQANYTFLSERRRLEDWMANGAAALSEAIDRGLRTLAEDIVDENFLLFYPPFDRTMQQVQEEGQTFLPDPGGPGHVPHYALAPIYPPIEFCFFCEGPFDTSPHRAIGNMDFVSVNSLSPELRWEPFPREFDLLTPKSQPVHISDVSYDLRVFEAGRAAHVKIVLVPAAEIYSKRGILTSRHRIESPLEACTDYFWTVRARFKLDGRRRATEWAGAFELWGGQEKPWNLRRRLFSIPDWAPALRPDGPEWFYFPFRTPCS
jgi:hypothetical protein